MSDSTKFDAALEAFEENVRDNIKMLSSKDAKARMKAAAWLGEAGDPTAITMLKQVYKDDPDPKVRDTAKYSLGMFRKLEEALKQSDQSKVQKLLEDVAVRGKIGGRVPISVRSLVKLEIALLISAILVAVLALFVPPLFKQGVNQVIEQNAHPEPTVPAVASKDRPTILSEMQSTLTKVNNNASKLQTQYQGMLGGGTLDCKQFFDTLTPIALSPENAASFADLATIANDINGLEATMRSAKGAYDRVCDKGEQLTAGDFGAPMGEVVKLNQSIATTQAALTTAAAKTS
jgi:hypothetical protein